jgi:hypothetical protein
LFKARILLKADAGPEGPAWIDARIAEALEVDVSTVERVRQRFVEQGLEAALGRKEPDRPSRPRTLDGAAEARLIALACSEPPAGRVRWTLRSLADKLVELEVVETVSTETVRRAPKKAGNWPPPNVHACGMLEVGPASHLAPGPTPSGGPPVQPSPSWSRPGAAPGVWTDPAHRQQTGKSPPIGVGKTQGVCTVEAHR